LQKRRRRYTWKETEVSRQTETAHTPKHELALVLEISREQTQFTHKHCTTTNTALHTTHTITPHTITQTQHSTPPCTHLIGVRGVADVVGAHVTAEDRAQDLVGQVVTLRRVAQQVARHLRKKRYEGVVVGAMRGKTRWKQI